MRQFMHIQLLASTIELIVNQALSMGNLPASALTKLAEKSLAISLAELNATLCLTVCQNKVLVTSPNIDTEDFDCTISTSISTLIQLKNEQQLTQLIKDDKLDLKGDIKVAQNYASLFESLNIDWQSELEKHLGDIATYKLVHLVKQVSENIKFAERQISSDAREWLVHEKKLLATKFEIDQFQTQVENIDKQMTNTEAQLTTLFQKLNHIQQSTR